MIVDKQVLAQEIVILLNELKRENLQHGDLHLKNITYRMKANGKKIDFLGLIDFKLSETYKEPSTDMASVLSEASKCDLIPDLIKVGLRIPQWFIDAVKRATKRKSPDEILSRMFKSSLPPYEPISMPQIKFVT